MAKADPWQGYPETERLQEAFLTSYPDSQSRLEGIERSFRRLWYRWRDENLRANTVGARLDQALRHKEPSERLLAQHERNMPPEEQLRQQQKVFQEIEQTLLANGIYETILTDLLPLLTHIHAETGKTVEIYNPGVGYGGFLRRLALRALEQRVPIALYGSERHPLLLEEAEEYLADLPLPCQLFKIDPLDLSPLPSKRFDIVFSGFLLHSYYPGQLARLLLEGKRVSRFGLYHLDLLRSTALYFTFSFLLPLARMRFGGGSGSRAVRGSFRLEELEFILQALELHPAYQVRFGPHLILPRATFVIEPRHFAEWRRQE